MAFLEPYHGAIEVAQIIISIALMISILLQARGASLGSVFGGTGAVFKTRRGIDKLLFNATIVFAVLFVLISFVAAAIPVPSTSTTTGQ
ncbi:MAG TPA: preprotein translocase subunit SecG [Ktedonobacterales bacterium]|nr:preprotein translocase subunit SecG [Ktedonobacterales bacterium]